MLYLLNKTDEFIDTDEPMIVKVGSDQIVKENKDVVRLLALLAETKAQLAKVKACEVSAQADKKKMISNMLAVQAELELALADIAILGKSNEELRAKLNQYLAA
jgi:ribosomal protein L29